MITNLVVSVARTGAGEMVMWFTVLLSIVSVAVIIERFIYFTRRHEPAERLGEILETALSGGASTSDALRDVGAAVADGESFEAGVMKAAIAASPRGRDAIIEMSEAAKKAERLRYERRLALLGTVGNNAPFLGLFGTVLEIISALYQLGTQSTGNVGAGAVMATLSQALAATAVGLLVALPAVASFNYFQRRLRAMQSSADVLVHTLLSYVNE